ncbi:Release factor glutamine methyltransferase [Carnimonas sp. R-84981]|uniref:peptide chain release factor N(5)-glutamine methyltransferase n=1 Tax=Carnimonas bestiolae TaxID=3402172 RepID=UPI003EDC8F9F
MTFDQALQAARERLAATSATAALDAEVLLLALSGKSRAWLYGFGDTELDSTLAARFDEWIERRAAGEPVAYLLGMREFFGLPLEVSPVTLIPRPDTELLVEQALALASAEPAKALDLGTGSGAIALAFASQRPDWQVIGSDRVAEAVALAQRNAERLGLGNTRWLHSRWFDHRELAPHSFALILSNPPYIAEHDRHLEQGDVRFEPRSALVAGSDGLDDIREIIVASPDYLVPGGWLLLEHGYDQASAVRQLMERQGFARVASARDLGGHERVTFGQQATAPGTH